MDDENNKDSSVVPRNNYIGYQRSLFALFGLAIVLISFVLFKHFTKPNVKTINRQEVPTEIINLDLPKVRKRKVTFSD